MKGGIHNLPATASLDLDQPGPRADEIRRLVEAADFFTLPATLKKPRPQPWDFSYALTVEDGARSHTVTCHKDAAPAELKRLIETLEPSARIEPPS